MIDRKILPINDAFIKAYPPLTMLLSILQHDPRAMAWVYENYFVLNVYTGEEYKGIETDHNLQKLNIREWTACPFLRKYLYPYHWVNPFFSSLSSLILTALQDNQYVYVRINIKYIPAYHCDSDFDHQVFVYGYDKNASIFYCADFIDSQYTKYETSFQSIDTAFENTVLTEDDIGGICGLQVQDPKYEILPNRKDNYLFTEKSLRLNLLKYLNPEINHTEYTLHNPTYYAGIEAYEGIRQLLSNNQPNIASMFSIYGNKVIIQKAFETAGLLSAYREELAQIVSMAKKILMLYVKSGYASDIQNSLDKIDSYLSQLEKYEQAFFSQVIRDLSPHTK